MIHWLRFATGLAAGLAIGLGVHFSLTRPEAGINTYPTNIVNNRADPTAIQNPAVQFRGFNRPPVIHNVDWYYMTNDTGDKWLIEGHRDGLARPVINYGDL